MIGRPEGDTRSLARDVLLVAPRAAERRVEAVQVQKPV